MIEIACPLFVPIIEEGWSDMPVAETVANTYLEPFQETEMDTLILGCTHYPIMAKTIQSVVGSYVKLVYSGETVERKLFSYLKIILAIK